MASGKSEISLLEDFPRANKAELAARTKVLRETHVWILVSIPPVGIEMFTNKLNYIKPSNNTTTPEGYFTFVIMLYYHTLRLFSVWAYSEHAPIRFWAWGSAPPMFLKLRTSGVAMFLICAFCFLLLKDPDTQMTCNAPKMWPHFGCNKHIFRLFSSLLSLLC